jgi:tetratricopeptide (TPR) repeat protein
MEFAPSSEAFATNYLEVVSKLGRNDEALAFLETKKATYSKSFVMRALKAKLLCQKGDTAAGCKEFAKLFADGCTDESTLMAYVEVANAAKAYDEELAVVDAVLKRKPTVAMQRLQAGIYAIKGDHPKALKLYEDLRTKYPNDVGIALDLASTYGRAKDYDAALKITQRLIDADKKDEAVLLLHGTFQLQLQQTVEAKKTFELAKERFPNSERVADMLKIASSQLGEGDNSCLKKPIAAVDVPPAVRDAIQQASQGEHPDASEFGAEELVRIVGLSFEPGKPMRKTVTHKIKVYNQGGVTRNATLTYRLDSVFERLYVNKLRVLDGSGNLISQGAVENYYVADDTSTTDASNRKAVKIPVPGLKPGYTIECTLTREFAVPVKDMPFEQIVMAGDSPIQVSAFFVQGDVGQVKWKTANVANVKHEDRLLYAVQKNTQPLREEPHQPAIETFAPLVWLGPAKTSWDAEAHEYLKMIDDRLHVDDATKKLASQLTAGCTTNRDKLLAIATHVQQSYTYRAIEFGRRARIPNAASRTIDLKYGDCKDHALLTRQLLVASGIDADLALVNASATVVEELPSLDQFNHVVVFVPSTEIDTSPNSLGGVCIDTTEKEADPLLEPPVGLANRTIMVLDPHNPHFIHTPDFPENASKVDCQRKLALEIRPSGAVDSHVTEDVTITGYLAPVMRGYFKHFDGESREEAMQSLLSQNGPIRVKRVEVSNLDVTREPLRIKVAYTVPNSFYRTSDASGEKSLVGSLPCGWESRFVLTPATDSRRTPFEVRMGRDIASTVDVELPDGYQIAGFDNYNANGHSQYGSWSSQASQDASKAHVRYQVHLVAGRHPAAAYEEFYSDMNDSLAVLRTPMTLRGQLNATGTAHRQAELPIAR